MGRGWSGSGLAPVGLFERRADRGRRTTLPGVRRPVPTVGDELGDEDEHRGHAGDSTGPPATSGSVPYLDSRQAARASAQAGKLLRSGATGSRRRLAGLPALEESQGGEGVGVRHCPASRRPDSVLRRRDGCPAARSRARLTVAGSAAGKSESSDLLRSAPALAECAADGPGVSRGAGWREKEVGRDLQGKTRRVYVSDPTGVAGRVEAGKGWTRRGR